MRDADYELLERDVVMACLAGAEHVAILGLTPVALRLLGSLGLTGLLSCVSGIYVDQRREQRLPTLSVPIRPMAALSESTNDILVIAADDEKEDLLMAALPHVRGAPQVVVSGYGHFRFRDPWLTEEVAKLYVPSLANGYPNTLTHIYQCLANAARLELDGIVAEFGMFKGGTTMLLSRIIEKLGRAWRVVGFDTFGGFPPRRSMLDMYAHPDCVFTDVEAVRRHLDGRNVEIVVGDLVHTARRLDGEDLVVSFVDTDNYSSAAAVLEVVRERTVKGGAIVFDHFTGVDRFRYTLGERIAGKVLLDDPRYFHLHGTGVFYRQC